MQGTQSQCSVTIYRGGMGREAGRGFKRRAICIPMYGCDSWTLKKAEHQRFDAFNLWLKKTLKSPLGIKKIKPVNPKGNQPWIFFERTDVEAESPILWPPDVKRRLIRKDPDTGKDWRQEKGWDRGWDGWMVSLTQWTWVWASSGRWWRTGNSGVLQSMVPQRVRHNWETEKQEQMPIHVDVWQKPSWYFNYPPTKKNKISAN